MARFVCLAFVAALFIGCFGSGEDQSLPKAPTTLDESMIKDTVPDKLDPVKRGEDERIINPEKSKDGPSRVQDH